MSKTPKTGKASLPWSVKGVGHEARNLAKEQAAASGETMGGWLSGVVRRVGATEAAGKDLVPAPGGEPASDATPPAEAERMDEAELVEMVSERIAATEDRLVSLLGNLEDIILRLGDRLDHLERRLDGAGAPAIGDRPTDER